MKTILIDAINGLISKEGEIFEDMYYLLEEYSNNKIILTSANDEQIVKFKLDEAPYEFFTLNHNPEKSDPEYYKEMLTHYGFKAEDVVYFEHDAGAVKSAQSIGITTYYYDTNKKNLVTLKEFLDKNLT
jgi:HAD superfamily hydrolase (TIGR01509 family)